METVAPARCTWRVGADRCVRAAVPEVVDRDLALSWTSRGRRLTVQRQSLHRCRGLSAHAANSP